MIYCRLIAVIVLGFFFANHARSAERITFATDWKAQAEHGGFYQAVAKGFYARRGLEVEIRMGGPAVNIPQLIGAGAIDFGMGSSSFMPLNMVREGIPAKAVMAVFQKSPEILMTHPREDIDTLADMAGKPIMLADASIDAVWVWLKGKYGFTDQQIRKYTFNLAPFLVDKRAIQQGYLTSEPYMVASATGVEPEIYLYADYGYPSYATLVLVADQIISERPDLVTGFVEATIEGWYDYLYGDPAPANQLIKQHNPEMTDEVIDQAVEKMKRFGIVDSGDAKELGIGAMTHDRWRDFFRAMSTYGVYDKDLDWREAYTLKFINKRHGLEPISE